MHRDVHLGFGTRIINTKTGQLGEVTTPFYMCRPEHHEICVRYDGMNPEASINEDRDDIEYEGTEWYRRAMDRWHPTTQPG